MKRSVLFIMLFIGLMAQAQVPVITLDQRLPNLYYWDTNWIDSKQASHPDALFYREAFTNYYSYPMFIGRVCVTPTPMKIIGLAAPVSIPPFVDEGFFFVDTSLESRVPEYFKLYQMEADSLYYLGSLRWDTATPQYKFSYTYNGDTLFSPNWLLGPEYDLYEAYFDKPVIVHDTFCVGGTIYNNQLHGVDSEFFPDNPLWYAFFYDRRPTVYPFYYQNYAGTSMDSLYLPNPPLYVRRYYSSDIYVNSGNGVLGSIPVDTNHFYINTYLRIFPSNPIEAFWLPFFAIFDTDFVYSDCMGVWTTGLQVESMDTAGVGLTWDDNGVEVWQVEVKPAGADSGMLLETPINYLLVTGLEQGKGYEVRVRTKCDSLFHGDWSLPVQFYLPTHFDTCMLPTGLHVAAADSGSVTLAWNSAPVLSWKVEMNPVVLGMTGGQTKTAETNSLQVDGLYPDMWYWARVMALCDTEWYSEWTDTIHFLVPNQHPSGPDTTTAINPVEQYTYLMPNPAREEVTVMSSFKVRSVELYGADGKLLKEQEVNALGTRLSLEGLPAGVYFVRVRTSAGVTTKRLVIE